MSGDNQVMITTKEAAEILGVKASTVHKYVKDGKLEPVYKDNWHIDATKLFYLEDVQKLVEVKPGITTGEAAKMLGLHPTTIAQYISRGLLKTQKKAYRGRKLNFIEPEEFERFKDDYESKKKEQKEFYDKDRNIVWFQLFTNSESQEVGRILPDQNNVSSLVTATGRLIDIEDISKEGFTSCYSISDQDYIHKKGFAKFSFYYSDEISNPVHEALDVFYSTIGTKNMKLSINNNRIQVEVKPFFLSEDNFLFLDVNLLKESITEGKITERHDGLFIDSDVDTITFALPSELKKMIKQDAEHLNRTMEEHVLEIISDKYNFVNGTLK